MTSFGRKSLRKLEVEGDCLFSGLEGTSGPNKTMFDPHLDWILWSSPCASDTTCPVISAIADHNCRFDDNIPLSRKIASYPLHTRTYTHSCHRINPIFLEAGYLKERHSYDHKRRG